MSWFVFWSNVTAFWSTVVVNCVQPVNIQYCLPVQDWLFPAIGDYIRFRTEEPYSSERELLESLQHHDELKRLKQTLQSLD
jgi:hypothetical protein